HSIVNMFLFPSGLMLGGKFSIMDYLIWNEIPTVVGNLVGGLAFTGLTLYATHVKTGPKRVLTERMGLHMRDHGASARDDSGPHPGGIDAARIENLGWAALGQRPQEDQSGFSWSPGPKRAAAEPQGHRGRAGGRDQLQPGQPDRERVGRQG